MGFIKICVGSAVCDRCGICRDWRNESDRYGTEFSRSITASLAQQCGWTVTKRGCGLWLCPEYAKAAQAGEGGK